MGQTGTMRSLKPDLSGDAFLRRHQNPAGLVLRAVCLLLILVALWQQRPGMIFLALLLDGLNWLYMPPRDNPPEWHEQVMDVEFALLDMPPSGLKVGLIAGLVIGAAFLALGLWTHHVMTILLGLGLILSITAFLRFLASR